jgi:hypothetical protein
LVKIVLDPIPIGRKNTKDQINNFFVSEAMLDIHREISWRRKKQIAQQVIDGGAAVSEFNTEASLRSLSCIDFAKLVLSKPDPIDARELSRQTALLAVDSSTTLAELSAIVCGLTAR